MSILDLLGLATAGARSPVEEKSTHKELVEDLPASKLQSAQTKAAKAVRTKEKELMYTENYMFRSKKKITSVKVGRQSTEVIDDLCTQYFVRYKDGKEGFVFKSEVKECK